jgi:hypothetical protein
MDEQLVDKVADALHVDNYGHGCAPLSEQAVEYQVHVSSLARAAIAALSTPEFVLPLAEKMLRGKGVYEVCLSSLGTSAIRGTDGVCMAIEDTLLRAYRAAKGE